MANDNGVPRVDETLLRKIDEAASETTHAATLLQLAEAYAWVVKPDNAHGGGPAR